MTSRSTRPPLEPCLNPATVTGLDLEDFLCLAAVTSFRTVELSIQQVVAYGPDKTAALLAELGLSVAAASGIVPAGPVLPAPLLITDDAYTATLTNLPERLAAFQTIGCQVATVLLNPRTGDDPRSAAATAVKRLRALAEVAADHGVRLAVEAVGVRAGLDACLEGSHEVAATLPRLAGLLERIGRDDVGVCVDSFHWAATGADPAHLTGLAPLRIEHVQIADVPADLSPDRWTDEMRLFPGEGALDWTAFTGALEAAEYGGSLSVELFNPELRLLPESEIATRAYATARAIVDTA
ncbi:sugar phosphate isomerase/epimerase family protein [Streptosporangium saharense]|uniref:sugar phosphate isomerase/epimerase family protein n=1 Tax=Streptosporangium saharense TaxID=1706840 RepID=UPI00341C734B